VRRRGHRLRGELTSEQTLELLIGPVSRSAFRVDDERRAAWFEHKAELMSLLPPDGRGWGWVMYEGGGFLPSEGGRVTAALLRIDVKKLERRK
jgi:hypothetical protein